MNDMYIVLMLLFHTRILIYFLLHIDPVVVRKENKRVNLHILKLYIAVVLKKAVVLASYNKVVFCPHLNSPDGFIQQCWITNSVVYEVTTLFSHIVLALLLHYGLWLYERQRRSISLLCGACTPRPSL